MANHRFLKQIRGAPVAFQALRRHSQALDPTHSRGFGAAQIIPVKVGRWVGCEKVKLDKCCHVNSPLLDSQLWLFLVLGQRSEVVGCPAHRQTMSGLSCIKPLSLAMPVEYVIG